MNTRSSVLYLVMAGVLGVFLLGCPLPQPSVTGAIVISLHGSAGAKTLLPAVSMDAASYTVSGTGPGGAAFSQAFTDGSVSVQDLVAGTWTITVDALNADGTIIGSGQATADVVGGVTAAVSVVVLPFSGTGTLSLTVDWVPDQVSSPSVLASLATAAGTTGLDFTVNGSQATFSGSSIPTGYSTLTLRLMDNGTPVAGAVEVVRIVKDQTTSGSFTFANVGATGGIQVNIDPQLGNPIPVSISGVPGTVPLGGTVTATASVGDGTTGVTYVWYLNGVSVATGPSYTFGGGLATGSYRLDATAFSADGARSGSANVIFQVTSITSVTGVSVAPSTLNVNIGGSAGTLTAAVTPANATNPGVTWTSSNPAVATVSASGVVTPVATGSTTITATTMDGGFTATSAVTVYPSPAVIVSPTSGLTTTEAFGTASFTVALSSPPTSTVSISASTSSATEILVKGGSSPGTPVSTIDLTFTSGNWSVPQTVTLVGQPDGVVDGNQQVTIVTGSAVSADASYNGLAVPDVTAVNMNTNTIDLTVQVISVTNNTGTTALVTCRVTNNGNTATGSYLVYVDAFGTLSSPPAMGTTMPGRTGTALNIPPGGQATVQVTVSGTFPPLFTQKHTYAIVDSLNVVPESNESNNVSQVFNWT